MKSLPVLLGDLFRELFGVGSDGEGAFLSYALLGSMQVFFLEDPYIESQPW